MSAWPLVPIDDLVTDVRRTELVQPESDYRLLGMRGANKGPFLRETKTGAEISATVLNKVRTGDFIYSKLFAWQGSFGIIPEILDECFVSNEFPLFAIDEVHVNPRYLNYWFGLPSTIRKVELDCAGSTPLTRNRYNERFFKKLEIPLPAMEHQREIVALLDGVASRLHKRQLKAERTEKDLSAMLHSAFREITEGAPKGRMGDVAPLVRRPVLVDIDGSYPELGVRSFGRGLFDKPTLKGGDLSWQKLFEIHEGDLVISNIKAWEGAFAVAEKRHHGKVGSHRYLTCVADKSQITPNFLWFYLQSQAGLDQIQAASPGSADRNRTLRQRGLEAITVPLPTLEDQMWFDCLQAKVAAVRDALALAEVELQQLIPSMLNELFGSPAKPHESLGADSDEPM